MIVYTLNENYLYDQAIDSFDSFIWTERFSGDGDFELIAPYDSGLHGKLLVNTLLAIPESRRIMVVEKVVQDRDELGAITVTYSGRSFESVLGSRVGYSKCITSHKGRLNDLFQYSIIDPLGGAGLAEDAIPNLYFGTGEIYPMSNIAPVLDPLPSSAAGWSNLLEEHESTTDKVPLGFRIVRDGSILYYDNYTGIDRTSVSDLPAPRTEWLYKNPYSIESDGDVVVYRNVAKNPGFTSTQQSMNDEEAEFGIGGVASISTTTRIDGNDIPSYSGSALVITPDGTNTTSAAYLVSYRTPTANKYRGQSWAGKSFFVQVKLHLPVKQTGTINAAARAISVRYWDASNVEIGSDIAQAANTVGTKSLSLAFTIPQNAAKWDLRLTNGVSSTEQPIYFYDLVIMEGSSNPYGEYFDGSTSSDVDLIPNYDLDGTSVLLGRAVQGISHTVGCKVVQSTQWADTLGVSTRMIHTDPSVTRPYAEMVISEGVEYVRGVVRQSKKFPGGKTGVKFGCLGIGDGTGGITPYASDNPKPNTENSELLQTAVADYPQDVLYLIGDFNDPGESLWFDTIVTASDYPTGAPITPLMFSETDDNFAPEKTFRSVEDHKNVAYVTYDEQLVVVARDVYEGTERRVVHVDASHLDVPEDVLAEEMYLLGREALRSLGVEYLIEGEVTPHSFLKYDEDYYLGDIVLVSNHQGVATPLRITEFIFTQDETGYKAYPTFSEQHIVSTGHWNSPQYNIEWSSAESLGTWAEQP